MLFVEENNEKKTIFRDKFSFYDLDSAEPKRSNCFKNNIFQTYLSSLDGILIDTFR